MKKVLLLLSVLILPMYLTAQDEEIDLSFDNEPLTEDARSYFVLAGGITFDWLMIKEDYLNSFCDCPDLLLSSPIQLTGGQGVTGIPWVKNLRVGVFGYGGSVESNQIDRPMSTANDSVINGSLQTSLAASMFGFSLHYGYVPFEHFAILGGVNAGWGDITYEIFASSTTIDDVKQQGDFGTDRLVKNYFFAMPNIQLEYALANFIIIRADASYNLTIGQDSKWTHNNIGSSTVNPNFDISGLKIGFGVMVGLVNF
ncbi:MAG: hypothetical protein WC121_08720 [Candidatus Kapaibacterium sp.]